jgi:hypothetical protein
MNTLRQLFGNFSSQHYSIHYTQYRCMDYYVKNISIRHPESFCNRNTASHSSLFRLLFYPHTINFNLLFFIIAPVHKIPELGTSDTFIDLPIFDTGTYRIQKKGSKYRTLKWKVSKYRYRKLALKYRKIEYRIQKKVSGAQLCKIQTHFELPCQIPVLFSFHLCSYLILQIIYTAYRY